MCLSTPLLFLIFNRPDTTRIVFDQIRKQRPRQLFIAADGPRPTRADDVDRCAQTRAIIEDIDWPCEVHTLLRDHNLGCGKAVSQAITWFFVHVEQGIILEDDCVPDPTFFDFCTLMLERYRNDTRVMMVTGMSYLFNKITARETYFFSRYYPVWGWATWRRAWQLYDFELGEWARFRPSKMVENFFDEQKIVDFWAHYFDRIVNHEIDTWDIQWTYACIKHQAFCVVPFNNLISNIGYFGLHATGIKSFDQDIERKLIALNDIIHPRKVEINRRMDRHIYQTIRVLQPFSIKGVIKKMIPFYSFIRHKLQ
jgi:hypothetical protein